MRTSIALVIALLACWSAQASHDRVLATRNYVYTNFAGVTVHEVWQLREVWVLGYFVYNTIVVGVEYDYFGNAYPITRTERLWVPGYCDQRWIRVQ